MSQINKKTVRDALYKAAKGFEDRVEEIADDILADASTKMKKNQKPSCKMTVSFAAQLCFDMEKGIEVKGQPRWTRPGLTDQLPCGTAIDSDKLPVDCDCEDGCDKCSGVPDLDEQAATQKK